MRIFLAAAMVVAVGLVAPTALAAPAAAPAPAHPLEPLAPGEIALATQLVRARPGVSADVRFPLVALAEPPKAEVLAWRTGKPFRREAQLHVYDHAQNRTYEAVVDLRARKVSSWRHVPGVQPVLLFDEYDELPKIVKADARWQEAMRRRGITDFAKVWIDPWATGSFAPKGQEGARLMRAVSYLRNDDVNFYAHPIEGVTAVVNLNEKRVVELVDSGVVPVSTAKSELDEKSLGRRAVAPLVITQPAGPGFVTDGNRVAWQGWSLRWAMHPREGLVLYDVRYQDGKVSRPVMYRGALSEMVVPYGDPDPHWVWRNAFDEGEYGLGRLASPLEPGLDAPANARLFDASFASDRGEPYTAAKVVGLYERDAGILWKHFDSTRGQNETRRGQELVLFFITTIGNYDYAVSWIFRQDGSIGVTCDLTGIMLAKGVRETTVGAPRLEAGMAAGHAGHGGDAAGGGHAHLVAPNVAAPHHQHFFSFRLDLDVDGQKNQAFELDTRAAAASPENPGNVIAMGETLLGREGAAQRDLDASKARKWRFGAAGKRGALGYQPSYLLAPGGNATSYLAPSSPVRARAPFLEHQLFVTRYRDDERHAAGWFPNQSDGRKGPLGVGAYAGNDESLDGQDLVVWYTVGITHVPRPEEWPVMAIHRLAFDLLPSGFFAKNPALDVPR